MFCKRRLLGAAFLPPTRGRADSGIWFSRDAFFCKLIDDGAGPRAKADPAWPDRLEKSVFSREKAAECC